TSRSLNALRHALTSSSLVAGRSSAVSVVSAVNNISNKQLGLMGLVTYPLTNNLKSAWRFVAQHINRIGICVLANRCRICCATTKPLHSLGICKSTNTTSNGGAGGLPSIFRDQVRTSCSASSCVLTNVGIIPQRFSSVCNN